MPSLPRTLTLLRWYLFPNPCPSHAITPNTHTWHDGGGDLGCYTWRSHLLLISSPGLSLFGHSNSGVMQWNGHWGGWWDIGGDVKLATRLVAAYWEQNIWLGSHLSPLGAGVKECCCVCSAMPHCLPAHLSDASRLVVSPSIMSHL